LTKHGSLQARLNRRIHGAPPAGAEVLEADEAGSSSGEAARRHQQGHGSVPCCGAFAAVGPYEGVDMLLVCLDADNARLMITI
jgi:hypothetical protein